MHSTVEGIDISVKDVHRLKAPPPIYFSEDGFSKITCFNDIQ